MRSSRPIPSLGALLLAVLAALAAVAALGSVRADAVRLVRVASVGDGLFVAGAPGERNRLYVVRQSGRIEIVQRGRRLAAPFLDLSARISRGGERGLLGLAFHPRYARNGRFFVNYTDRAGNTRVVEYRRSRNRNRANPRSARLLLRITQPFANHNGGMVAFGPDGFLYVGSGDGGSADDPLGNGQRVDTLLGKILRIDVNRRQRGRRYAIPAGNPFRSGAAPEIYHYGLRNPWRFSFDLARGDLWIGDVGQNAVEEIDFARRGAPPGINFGWNAFEGRRRFGGAVRGRPPTGPVAQYTHARGCSVTGGYVYRGRRVPALRGRYVFSDFCSGRVWTLRAGPRPGRLREITGNLNVRLGNVTSFGEGTGGELYVIGSGNLYRFAR